MLLNCLFNALISDLIWYKRSNWWYVKYVKCVFLEQKEIILQDPQRMAMLTGNIYTTSFMSELSNVIHYLTDEKYNLK